MGVPNSEVGYTSAMPRREDHQVRKGHVGHWEQKKILPRKHKISLTINYLLNLQEKQTQTFCSEKSGSV